MSSFKRRRGNTGAVIRSRRPIDKQIFVVNKPLIAGNTQASTALGSALNRAVTVTGLRWSLYVHDDLKSSIHWCIVLVREGTSVSTIATSDASTLYAPEQNVLAHGILGTGSTADHGFVEGSTKSMRKMLSGDQLFFVFKTDANAMDVMRGIVQLFFKE